MKHQFADHQLHLINTAQSLKFLEEYADRQAQIWKIFQKHQTIPEDIQDLHLHFDDFKKQYRERICIFERSHLEKCWKLSTDILRISMLTCEQYIYIINWWNYSGKFNIVIHI